MRRPVLASDEVIIGEYCQHVYRTGRPAAREQAKANLRHLARWRRGRGLLSVDDGDLRLWLSIRSITARPATVQRYRKLVVDFYRWARENDFIDHAVGESLFVASGQAALVIAPELDRLLDHFATYQRRRNLAAATIGNGRLHVRRLAHWVALDRVAGDAAEPIDITTLTADDVNRWIDSTGVGPHARRNYIVFVHRFFVWAMKEGVATTDPTATIDPPKVGLRLPRPLRDSALAEALETADARTRCWLLLGAYQGCRCIEISRLRGEDVDAERMTITVLGKGDKERTNPLHPEVLEALERHGLPARGPVFKRVIGGGPIGAQWISRELSRHLADTGTAHQLRHWFGTKFYDGSGGDLLLTQWALGHASPATTAVYAQVSGARGRAVIQGLAV